MKSTTISIINTINDTHAIDAEDGQKVYDLLKKSMDAECQIILSFRDIEVLTIAFLNTVFGQLYKAHSKELIKQRIQVTDISDSGRIMLKRLDNAVQLYDNNQNLDLQKSINEILEN